MSYLKRLRCVELRSPGSIELTYSSALGAGSMESNEGEGWYLEGLLGPGRTWLIRLDPIPFLIGRDSECNLTLSSKEVSRHHAQIEGRAGRLWVKDLGSTNGTFVNRRKINRDGPDVPLGDDDILHFGTLEFRITRGQRAEMERQVEASADVTSFELKDELPQQFVNNDREFEDMLRTRAVSPQYQPIMQLNGKKVVGYELVGRGNYKGLPRGGEDLMGIAERLGKEIELSELFRQEGLALASKLPEGSKLFVSIHPTEMDFKGLTKTLREIRTAAGHLSIVVEVDEKALTDVALMRRFKEMLEASEMGLAYDDFGAGQSRLVELIEAPPDYLKFDIALLRDIQDNARTVKMLKTLVKMTKDLGVTAVAKGIETDDEAATCKSVGFDCAQGYFYGRPFIPGREELGDF